MSAWVRDAPAPIEPRSGHVYLRHPRLRLLAEYVEGHWNERLTLARAAEIVGLRPSYLSRLFRETMGCTFRDWNRAVRMDRAAFLLGSSNQTIMSVAIAVGYRDLTTFGRAFKRHRGVSPTDYRAAYWAGFPRPLGGVHRVASRQDP